MEVGPLGIKLIKHYEGLRLESYRDEAMVWTIGWGRTRGVANYPYSISSLQAERLLREDLTWVAKELAAMVLSTMLEQHEFDALASWVFNVGSSKARTSTLIRKLNLGEPREEVAAELLRWRWITLGDGTKVQKRGLVRRRESERQLFLMGKVYFF